MKLTVNRVYVRCHDETEGWIDAESEDCGRCQHKDRDEECKVFVWQLRDSERVLVEFQRDERPEHVEDKKRREQEIHYKAVNTARGAGSG